MADSIDVYSLASRGVVVDKSDVHTSDEELLHAQNWQVDAVGGRGSIRRRDGLLPLNAIALAGPILGGVGVPLVDRSLLARTFYLALNDGMNSFKTSTNGTSWTTVTIPARPVREATLGADIGQPYGDSAMLWQGFGDTLYYPGDDYSSAAGLAMPSLHAWNGVNDVISAFIPANPLDLNNTVGPFGITSLVPFSDSKLLVAVADRNSTGQGRSRVLLLDTRDGTFQQLGASAVLSTGHLVTGIVVWQQRVWITAVNTTTGGALVTFWINADPADAEWTQDDSFGTQHGFGTGNTVFRGDLYQASAAESGQHALIRRRVPSSAGSATVTTAVSVGSSSVAGVATVVARPAPVTCLAGRVPTGAGVPEVTGDWRAQYTFKYADGIESLPSPASPVAVTITGTNDGIVIYIDVGDANVAQRLMYLKKPGSSTYDGNIFQTAHNTPGVYTAPDNTTTAFNVSAQTAGSTRHPPSSDPGYTSASSYIYVDDCSQFLSGGGSAKVGSVTFTYTGRTASSGVGALTGVSGITGTILAGATISAVVAASATIIPILDTTNFFAAGTASVGGNTVTWTGRSTTSGPGNLTGVSGVSVAIVAGTAIVAGSVPIAATELPIADTSNFAAAGGSATAAGQSITYTGRSTTSGRGFLTGVSGITPAIANGATVSITSASVTVWTTVYTSDGTGAGNYVGPMIVTQDGGTLLAFFNNISGGATPKVRILASVDGVVWTTDYNISGALSDSYGRSGMPLLDDNGDIYWPLASGSAGAATGGVLKRTAAGVWSVVLSGLTNVRGPLGIIRT